MKFSKRIAIALALIVTGSGAVYAYGKHDDWRMTPREKADFIGDRVAKKLALNAGQRQNFDTLAQLVVQIVADARAGREAQLEEIGRLLEEPSFNQARALEIVRQKTALVEDKAPLVVSSLAVFLDSLNAEQKQQLREFVEHRHRHHRHHGERQGVDG
jgi:hypothetical protein